jgi:hypothetical protein
MLNITILICLYKKSINESKTIQSLLNASETIKDSKFFIWDNSPAEMDSDSLKVLTNIFGNLIYKHTPENTVLSKIYNYIIEGEKDPSSYLILFDDDSEIPITYFDELKEEIEFNPLINLFLPQVYSKSVLVSPAKDYILKTILIKQLKIGTINSSHITAINSGMVISNRVFIDGFRYDESLNFYGTDNFFMVQYVKKYPTLFVLKTEIGHNLSFNDTNNIDSKIRIFKEIKRANNIIYADNKLKKSFVILNNLFVSLKLSMIHKNTAFIYDK